MLTYDFSEDDVRKMVRQVVEQFDGTGWEYLAKHFPILLDDKMTMMDKFNLDMHDTFSFANKYYVGFSESRALAQITNYYSSNKLELSWSELKENIKDVIIHEYGHILLEHVFEKPMAKQLDAEAQVITAEIETNRGIPKEIRAKYFDDVIIADDKEDFKSVQPFITHKAVFDEVKRLRKQNDQDKQQMPEQSNNASSGDKDDNKKDKSDSEQPQQKPSKMPPTNQKSEQNSEQEKEQIKKPDHVGTMVQAMRDSQGNDNAPLQELLSELGLQASDDFKNSGDIQERLKILTELEQNNEIKKTLSKIKGSLVGDVCRERVGTYSRPSRRTGEDGLMRKGVKRGETKRPNILIALDESGSMNSTAVKTAATAVELVSKTIGRNRADITICSFSYGIHRQAKLKNYHSVVDQYYPTGGTNFGCVIELAKKLGCDVVLCIGDGEDSLPEETYGIKGLDVLITGFYGIEQTKQYQYTEKDRETGRRETLWLGNNKRRIEQFASNM